MIRDIGEVKQFLVEERNQRQEMEARIRTNLEIINEKLLPFSKRNRKPLNVAELQSKFKIPIKQVEQVQTFEDFLDRDPDYKGDLVSIMKMSIITSKK